jgi:hypothetical protein
MREGKYECWSMKVPRQCPLVLLVKVDQEKGKAFGSREGTAMKSGERRGDKHSLTAMDRKLKF